MVDLLNLSTVCLNLGIVDLLLDSC
eukprot:SAG31_NODE_23839_length_494_cov_1.202532_1_plen_24_part_10